MSGQTAQPPHAAAGALATSQYDVVSRRQLLELGFTRHAINHRLAKGRLHRVFNGVYAVGRPRLSPHGYWIAAVLACGPAAAVSHMSAAALWRIVVTEEREIDISVPVAACPRRPGIAIHRRSALRDEDVTRHRRIPVTTPACTLVDIAPGLSRDETEG